MRIRAPRINLKALIGRYGGSEIPRWIGLSLVGILLVGMGSVAFVGIREGRLALKEGLASARRESVGMLTTTLSALAWDDDGAGAQNALRFYARTFPCDSLRVVDASNRVIASIQVEEIGLIGRPLESEGGEAYLFRTPTPVVLHSVGTDVGDSGESKSATNEFEGEGSEQENGAEGTATTVYVEGVWEPTIGARGVTTSTPWILGIVACVAASFLVLYRKMRVHFRGMSRIQSHLISRGDEIEQDLQLMRLTDERTALAEQWNKLVDLVSDLSANARRNAASEELTHALAKSQKGELGELLNVLPDGVMHVVSGGRLSYANAVAKRLLGLEGDVPEKASLGSLSFSESGSLLVAPVIQASSAGGAVKPVTEDVELHGGTTTYRVKVAPFGKRQPHTDAVVVIKDISQQVRADKSVEEFVSQVTHELRTPLTNIRAYAESLSSGVFDDPKLIMECYNVITKETRRLSRLIEDILSVSQLEVGSIRLELGPVDMKALVSESVKDYRGLADESEIDMQVSLPSKLPEYRGDRDKLSVVLNNLLGNALKYTPAGGSVHVGVRSTGEELLISVKDTGIGIEAADHERIFEKFQRGSSAEVSDIQGTGIGLTTAREIVRGHGGTIEVISAPGEGSTFVAHLPLNQVPMGTVGGAREST